MAKTRSDLGTARLDEIRRSFKNAPTTLTGSQEQCLPATKAVPRISHLFNERVQMGISGCASLATPNMTNSLSMPAAFAQDEFELLQRRAHLKKAQLNPARDQPFVTRHNEDRRTTEDP